jgi:hypothetical protein
MRLSDNRGRNKNTDEYWNVAEVNPYIYFEGVDYKI